MARKSAGSRWGFILVLMGFIAAGVLWSLKYLHYGPKYFAVALCGAMLSVLWATFGQLWWKRRQWVKKREALGLPTYERAKPSSPKTGGEKA